MFTDSRTRIRNSKNRAMLLSALYLAQEQYGWLSPEAIQREADRLSSAVAAGGSGGDGDYGPESYTYNLGTGNLSVKAGVSYIYGDANHKHAVTSFSNNTYGYDNNGNMTSRNIGGTVFTLAYDAENHLTGVSGDATATFWYDGDGKRVKATVGTTTTIYPSTCLASQAMLRAGSGDYLEWTGSTSTRVSYYYANGTRIAMRVGNTRYWLFSDHLGSTAITANSSGTSIGELRYKAWGEQRFSSGTTYTRRHFTGQIDETSSIGLYFFNARFYDPSLGRFAQADSIIPEPGDPKAWDRYAYVLNSPIKYIDPLGHWSQDQLDEYLGIGWKEKYFGEKAVFQDRNKLLEFLLSENTTDPIILDIIRAFFNVANTAYNAGVDFRNIDAFGARITLSGGVGGVAGVSADVILNLSSGEFSGYISPEGGILIGEGITIVGGVTMYSNMPSNNDFRQTSKAIGILGGDVVGINAEKSWGGVHYFQDDNEVFSGTFIGIGGATPGIGVYGTMAFAIEALEVDYLGYQWFPNPPSLFDALLDIGEVLWNDVLGLP